jgi:hypothetical protein
MTKKETAIFLSIVIIIAFVFFTSLFMFPLYTGILLFWVGCFTSGYLLGKLSCWIFEKLC